MRTYFTMLLLAMVVSFVATPIASRLAFLIGAVDRPDPRKIHREPTARLGGFAVAAGFCAPILALYFLDNRVAQVFQANESLILALIFCGLTMFAVGVVDDVVGISAGKKLVLQIIVAIGMYWGGFRINELSTPLGPTWQLGWLSGPITVIWIVGLTNATNLLDGMDGLVAGVAAVLAVSLAMINILGGNSVVALLTFCLAGSALGFLPYNYSPARIFLGDSGSLFLGLVMAGISTISLFKAATAALVLVPLLLFGLPLFDTTQVVIGRLRRGQHPFSPDKTHVHHKLLRLGLNQKEAAFFLYVISIFLGIAAIILSKYSNRSVFVGLLVVGGLIGASLLAWSWHLRDRRRPPEDPVPRPDA
ncbi:MAG: undecaprenyl/decaprenyl-phosphate alpha-N-acetylglucosaminyl 1-phosphate transferase [Verrucomicrobiales bacterium]|nr:undecaprenyl/decaprenyl-phosphate alpha-N-acetylglucosaminyl 1-phosphate transferase [Verrucomicrobiales bacterium]